MSWFSRSCDRQEQEIEYDPIVGELMNRVLATGKSVSATIDEDGVVTFEEWE